VTTCPELFAQVAVNRPLWTLFTYRVPRSLADRLSVGCRVIVPFGPQQIRGVVIELVDTLPEKPPRLRDVDDLVDPLPLLTADLIDLGRRVSEYYLCPTGEAFDAMMPPPAGSQKGVDRFSVTPAMRFDAVLSSRAKQAIRLYEALSQRVGGATRREIDGLFPGASRHLKRLVDVGLVEVSKDAAVPPESTEGWTSSKPFLDLTDDQRGCHDVIAEDLSHRSPAVHLVHGITGSGKTEIYLHLIRLCRSQGRGAVFLLPEIALTIPMMGVLKDRFGPDVALLHSGQTPKERYGEWLAIAREQKGIVVGARSAVFAPVARPGLFIMDEESETSYKQDERPCYNAREIARYRALQHGAVLVLGSATPSLETYQEALDSNLPGVGSEQPRAQATVEDSARRSIPVRYHRLSRRINGLPLPPVTLVDMSKEFAEKKNRSIFSMELKARLSAALASGGQALLFLNRRGHSTYVFCRACGKPTGCRSCSVVLTYHMATGRMLCHMCGHETEPPRVCPECGHSAVRYCGGGTQKVEEEFRSNFPDVTVCRMDSDTTSRRGSHQRIIQDFASGQTRVLVGTQMVAKGFDFHNLDLVGVVNADSTLHTGDFRGAERTFQIVTQVAGRVGRGQKSGLVVVQTYSPEHHALQAASRHDFEALAAVELPQRQALSYPPFSSLVAITAEGESEDETKRSLEQLKQALLEAKVQESGARILGPAPARVMKVADRFRFSLLVKLPIGSDRRNSLDPGETGRVFRSVVLRFSPPARIGLKVDIDPL